MWPLPVVLCIVSCQRWTILCTSFRPDVGQSWAHIGTQVSEKPVLSFLVQSLYQVWDCFGTSLFHFWVSVFLFHFWYRKCTKINPKVVHSLPRKSSSQTWYNPWLILRPKVVHYLTKKTGGLSAARRFSILFWNYIPFVVNAFWVLPSHIWSEILRSTSWYLSPQRQSSQR